MLSCRPEPPFMKSRVLSGDRESHVERPWRMRHYIYTPYMYGEKRGNKVADIQHQLPSQSPCYSVWDTSRAASKRNCSTETLQVCSRMHSRDPRMFKYSHINVICHINKFIIKLYNYIDRFRRKLLQKSALILDKNSPESEYRGNIP